MKPAAFTAAGFTLYAPPAVCTTPVRGCEDQKGRRGRRGLFLTAGGPRCAVGLSGRADGRANHVVQQGCTTDDIGEDVLPAEGVCGQP